MADLITLAELTSRITLTADQLVIAPTLITRASAAIERACGRQFGQADYVWRGQLDWIGYGYLPSPPVRVKTAFYVDDHITVENTTANGYAFILPIWEDISVPHYRPKVMTGVKLTSVHNGTETNTSLLFATYTTISTLVAAISAVSGWSAVGPTNLNGLPSSHICLDGPIETTEFIKTVGVASTPMPIVETSPVSGVVRGPSRAVGRIAYTGGFSTIPDDVKELCVLATIASLSDPDKETAIASGIKKTKLGELEIEYSESDNVSQSSFERLRDRVAGTYRIGAIL